MKARGLDNASGNRPAALGAIAVFSLLQVCEWIFIVLYFLCMNHEATNNEILEAINQFATDTQAQFNRIDSRFDKVESDISGMKSEIGGMKSEIGGMKYEIKTIKETMVTRDHFNRVTDKLFEQDYDHDKRLRNMVELLRKKNIFSAEEANALLLPSLAS